MRRQALDVDEMWLFSTIYLLSAFQPLLRLGHTLALRATLEGSPHGPRDGPGAQAETSPGEGPEIVPL